MQRKVYDQVVAGLRQAFQRVSWGDPQDQGTLAGPLISARQRDRVADYLRIGREAQPATAITTPATSGTSVQGAVQPESAAFTIPRLCQLKSLVTAG